METNLYRLTSYNILLIFISFYFQYKAVSIYYIILIYYMYSFQVYIMYNIYYNTHLNKIQFIMIEIACECQPFFRPY